MNKITGVITNSETFKKVDIPLMAVCRFDLKLKDDREWDVGIDQSTSCTGICLQDTKKEFQVLLDVKRDKALSKNEYYNDLFYLLKRLFAEKNIRYLVYERPAPKDMYASRVLQELKGHLDEWIRTIPELEFATVESVFPQTWKKYIVDKSKGKGRGKIKSAIAEDLCDRFIMLSEYKMKYLFTDYDSFDACGILNGFLEYAYCDGMPCIHGTIEKTHVAIVGYLWVDSDKLDCSQILGDFTKVLRPKLLAMNPEKNLNENIRMASSNNRCVMTILPRKYLDALRWELGVDVDEPGKTMLMLVLRKSEFTFKTLECFNELVPWNKEIYGNV